MSLFNQSVCLSVCVALVVFTDAARGRFPQTRDTYYDFIPVAFYASGRLWANPWDVFSRTPSRGGHGRRAAVDFVACFGCGGDYFVFSMLILHFQIRAHDLWLRETQSSQRRLLSLIHI